MYVHIYQLMWYDFFWKVSKLKSIIYNSFVKFKSTHIIRVHLCIICSDNSFGTHLEPKCKQWDDKMLDFVYFCQASTCDGKSERNDLSGLRRENCNFEEVLRSPKHCVRRFYVGKSWVVEWGCTPFSLSLYTIIAFQKQAAEGIGRTSIS